MVEKFINPNWHVILVHYPLGLLTTGVLIELLSFLWRRSSIRTAGRWMILLGALLSIPAATTGIHALVDIASPQSVPPAEHWQDLTSQLPWTQAQWTLIRRHVILTSSATVLLLLATVLWLAGSDTWRKRLHVPVLLALVVGVSLLCTGAWYAGEAVYRHGLAVAPAVEKSVTATQEPASSWERFASPLQVHLLAAGLTMAFAWAALGLSIRRWTGRPAPAIQAWLDPKEEVLAVPGDHRLPGLDLPISMADQDLPDPPPAATVGPARFWLLAMLLAAVAAATGLWYTEGDWKLEGLRHLLQDATNTDKREAFSIEQNRLLIHILLGANLLVMPLILAALTRFTRRLKWVTLLAALLYLAATIGQLWVGVKLLYSFK